MSQSNYRFIEWIPVSGSPDYLEECLIVKTFPNNEKVFINLKCLDRIDLGRIKSIITSRAASLHTDLASLLSEQVLGNGMNALTYFHQLAKILSPADLMVRNVNSSQILAAPRALNANNQVASAPSQTLDESMEPSFEQVAASKPNTTARK